mgnify:CR=1 FL=1
MPTKERLKLKDLKLGYFKEYFAPLFNLFKPKKKISNILEFLTVIDTFGPYNQAPT